MNELSSRTTIPSSNRGPDILPSSRDDELLAAYEKSLAADTDMDIPTEMDHNSESAATSHNALQNNGQTCFVCQKGVLTVEGSAVLCPSCMMRIECGRPMDSPEPLISHVRQISINHEYVDFILSCAI